MAVRKASGTRRRTAKKAARKTSVKKATARKTTAKTAVKRAATKAAATTKRAAAKKTTAKTTTAKKSAARKAAPRALARYQQKRDFTKTREPSGAAPVKRGKALRFVIQKHDASHLHYDFRLELGGVMKSWAVPKGPSVIPGERRLAMEVEDHPISYNTFEGTIPAGEYGGGTVMLWDRGTYAPTSGGGEEALAEGYAKGKLDITLHGERLQGGFTLVRTEGHGERAHWLLMKRSDEHADRDRHVTLEVTTSVASGRTMEQLAKGGRVWRSNR